MVKQRLTEFLIKSDSDEKNKSDTLCAYPKKSIKGPFWKLEIVRKKSHSCEKHSISISIRMIVKIQKGNPSGQFAK